MGFDFHGAKARLESESLTERNRKIVEHWLSLWPGDALPQRGDFRPRGVAPLLTGIALFDVVPNQSVTCRLAGTALRGALGVDITGKDWLALTKEAQRATRLARYTAIAEGNAAISLLEAPHVSGAIITAEQVLLPFESEPGGICTVLMHVDWRPSYSDNLPEAPESGALAREFRLVPLGA
jgi:hypothetical protein